MKQWDRKLKKDIRRMDMILKLLSTQNGLEKLNHKFNNDTIFQENLLTLLSDIQNGFYLVVGSINEYNQIVERYNKILYATILKDEFYYRNKLGGLT